jgi:hypothetical protein
LIVVRALSVELLMADCDYLDDVTQSHSNAPIAYFLQWPKTIDQQISLFVVPTEGSDGSLATRRD